MSRSAFSRLFALAASAALVGGAAAQVPPDIAAKLREIGPVIAPADTAKLYRPLHAVAPFAGVAIERDVAFGADPKLRLNVYRPDRSEAPRPVLVFFPGGQGNKQMAGPEGEPFYDNVGVWAVRNGMVAVVAQYRTGGGAPWDAGARDATAAVAWVKANIAARGGRPDKVVLFGQSNGAAQLANYLGHADIHGAGGPPVSGVILMGGAYNILPVRLKAEPSRPIPAPGAAPAPPPAPVDPQEMLRRSNLAGLKAVSTPIYLIAGEIDPADRIETVSVLGEELCKVGKCPERLVAKDHSHISQVLVFNTPDQSIPGPMLRWIRALP